MLDFTPGQREKDPEQLCAGVSLDFSWGPGDFDPVRLCPGGVWGFTLGYGEVHPEWLCPDGVPGFALASGDEDLERLCLGNNLDSTLEQGDTDRPCLGGVLDATLLGLGEEEPERLLCLGEDTVNTAFTFGCGEDDLDGLRPGGVLAFI